MKHHAFRLKNVAALAASVLVLASCASSGNGEPVPTGMYGMIYDRDGAPVMGAELIVDGNPAASSDSGGRFYLDALAIGEHALEARKRGFETYSGEFEFRSGSDVLYVKIVSAAWLLDEAEAAAARRDWNASIRATERVLAIAPDDPVAAFLLGVQALLAPSAEHLAPRAVELLEKAAARGERESSLFLLLAELYEKRLGDGEGALGWLREAGSP